MLSTESGHDMVTFDQGAKSATLARGPSPDWGSNVSTNTKDQESLSGQTDTTPSPADSKQPTQGSPEFVKVSEPGGISIVGLDGRLRRGPARR